MRLHTVRLLVVDDHELVRAGICGLCRQLPFVEAVAEATDGCEVVDAARECRPDIVLMDISMKTLNGIDATVQLKREFPDVHVIMLSMYSGERWVLGALQAGAAGYLIKDSSVNELELAFNAVMQGEVYLSPAISKQLVQSYMQFAKTGVRTCGTLTPRQCQILKLIAEGNNSKGIAIKLGVSSKTVDVHRAQIMSRLGIRDVPGLVRYAMRMGLISPEC